MRLSPQNTCCSLSWSYPVWLQCWCAVDLTPLLLYLVSSATLPLSSPQAVLTAAAFARQAGALAAADKFKAESAQVPVCLVAVGCVTDVKASFMPLPHWCLPCRMGHKRHLAYCVPHFQYLTCCSHFLLGTYISTSTNA